MTRMFVRSRAAINVTPAEVAAALREALDADGMADFFDEVDGAPVLAFGLHVHGHGVIARTPDGQHLGTFANALIGVQHAFRALDRASQQRRPARPRPNRARRPATKEDAAP